MRTSPRAAAAGLVAVLLLAGCSDVGGPSSDGDAAGTGPARASRTPAPSVAAAGPSPSGPPGERVVEVGMPAPYTPAAPGKGTDDYRCFLLDPELTEDAFVTGLDVAPGNRDTVHHVILFRVPPGQVAQAEQTDDATPGQGWTCFGGSGLESLAGNLEDAPWLGAWAPGGGEQEFPDGVGIPLEAGSRVVMQVHYSLLAEGGADAAGGAGASGGADSAAGAGAEADRSRVRLRVAGKSADLDPLETMLLPAPVELPCRARADGPLCDRDAAVRDVVERFGPRAGHLVAGLHVLCGAGGRLTQGPVQSCSRTVTRPATVHAAAGHMHLLGRSIQVRRDPGTPRARTLLDLPVWDFDDQSAHELERPVRLRPGDELEVTCTHDQRLRDLLPSLRGQPERYVVWGEGTTDEMCLGVLLVTRP